MALTDKQLLRNNEVKAHLNQAAVHLVDVIANIRATALDQDGRLDLKTAAQLEDAYVVPLKAVLGEVVQEIMYLNGLEAGQPTSTPDGRIVRFPVSE